MKVGYIRARPGVDFAVYEKFEAVLMEQGAEDVFIDRYGKNRDEYLAAVPDGSTLYLVTLDHLGPDVDKVRSIVTALRDRGITVYCSPFDFPVVPELITGWSREDTEALKRVIETNRRIRKERRQK